MCADALQDDNLEIYGRTHMIDCPLGVPGLSIPIGLASDSMPIGIMLYGRPGDSPCMLRTTMMCRRSWPARLGQSGLSSYSNE